MTDTIGERFRVTETLLRRSLGDEDAADLARIGDDAVSTTDAIERAVALITPERCGIPLVRIGPPRDGGYLVPDDLAGIDACFSPGTNNVKRFEDELATRYRIRSFMCDRTSDVEKLRTPLIDGFQTFEKKWLDVEPSEDDLDINDWVRESARQDRDLLLQMDIEGAEYRNLLHATEDTLARFRIVVVELHALSLLGQARFADGVFLPALERLGRRFACVHAHPNNCCGSTSLGDGLVVPNVVEVTFLRRDRLRPDGGPLQLPHADDMPNVQRKPPLHLRGPLRRNADPVVSDRNALEQTLVWLRTRVAARPMPWHASPHWRRRSRLGSWTPRRSLAGGRRSRANRSSGARGRSWSWTGLTPWTRSWSSARTLDVTSI